MSARSRTGEATLHLYSPEISVGFPAVLARSRMIERPKLSSRGASSPRPSSEIVSVTDAIVAGEGEGPLAPTPHPLGLVTLAASPAAAEWMHAGLMGFDPRRIPIVAHAFDRFRFPLAPCPPDDVVVRSGGAVLTFEAACRTFGRHFAPPGGWRGHCELVAASADEVHR